MPDASRPRPFAPPPLACDCHAHVVGPFSRYPLQAPRSYTPPERTAGDYLALLDRLGLDRAVIVQPSFFGLDNSCTLDFAASDPARFRAVVVVDDGVSDETLRHMHAQGARGVRLNLVFKGGITPDAMAAIARRIAPLGWHIQVLMDITALPDMADVFATLPVPVVFDHMGHFPAAHGTAWAGFKALQRLADRHETWVKLSGAYRLDDRAAYLEAAAPVARALIAQMPGRLVWATDWPHVGTGNIPADTADILAALPAWCDGDAALLHRILVDNPARLYGFP